MPLYDLFCNKFEKKRFNPFFPKTFISQTDTKNRFEKARFGRSTFVTLKNLKSLHQVFSQDYRNNNIM